MLAFNEAGDGTCLRPALRCCILTAVATDAVPRSVVQRLVRPFHQVVQPCRRGDLARGWRTRVRCCCCCCCGAKGGAPHAVTPSVLSSSLCDREPVNALKHLSGSVLVSGDLGGCIKVRLCGAEPAVR